MEQILVNRNERAVQQERDRLVKLAPVFNDFAEAWNALGIDTFSVLHLQDAMQEGHKIKDNKELAKFLVLEHVQRKIEPQKHGGFEVKRSIIAEQLELPDYSKLVDILETTTEIRHEIPMQNLLIFSEFFKDSKQGIIIDEKVFKEKVTDTYSLYATTDSEKETLEVFADLRNAVLKADAHMRKRKNVGLVYRGHMESVYGLDSVFDATSNSLDISPSFFTMLER